jgi:hypothetical protein
MISFLLKNICQVKQENHICGYPEDRVPSHTSSKSTQGAGRASTRCHVSCNFGSNLPTDVGSGTTMFPTAPDLASLLKWTPALPRVSQLRSLPPWRGELRCCHVSHGSELWLPERGAPLLPRVPRLRALPSWEGSSGATTCHTAPSGLCTTGIKKCLAALSTQLGSRVCKARSCGTDHSWTWLQFSWSGVPATPSSPIERLCKFYPSGDMSESVLIYVTQYFHTVNWVCLPCSPVDIVSRNRSGAAKPRWGLNGLHFSVAFSALRQCLIISIYSLYSTMWCHVLGGGSLSLFIVYLLLCDVMFWVLANWFCICVFLNHFCFFSSGFFLTS